MKTIMKARKKQLLAATAALAAGLCTLAVSAQENTGRHEGEPRSTQEDSIYGSQMMTARERAAYRSTVENSIYVADGYRGRGVADQLMGDLVKVARTSGFHSVIARIGGGNEASTTLHAKHGFVEVGVERQVGRKFNRWVDVTVMQIIFGD